MKEVFLEHSLQLLNKEYNYQDDDLDRVKYGLEVIYISITKMFVILLVSILFRAFKETLLMIIFVNGLRTFAYGIHAKKSWHCYVSSIICFVLSPMLFKYIEISSMQKILISVICFIGYAVFAPADTHKRPLINIKHRKKLKINTLIICSIYIAIIFISKNTLINNMIILSMITEMFVINPIVYKIFDMPYNNYMTYQSK